MSEQDKTQKNRSFFASLSKMFNKLNILVFSLFVFIAAVLWFFNALDNSFVTQTQVSVKFQNLPSDRVLLKDLPDELNVSIKGNGYILMRYKLQRDRIPIVFDLDKYKLQSLPQDEYSYFIPTTEFSSTIAKRFKGDVKITKISPDTLFFYFTEMVTRKVPVKVNVDYSFNNQYMLNGNISIKPDSVTISGPEQIVAKTNFVETEYRSYGSLSSSFQRNLQLVKNDLLEYSEYRVVLNIPIEKYSEKVLKVEVNPVQVPDSINVRLIPRTVDVSFKAPLSIYNSFNPSDFELNVNIEGYKSGMLMIEMLKYPNNVMDISLSPGQVRCIIEPKM